MQLGERRKQLDSLQVRASCDGTVTPPITFGVLNVVQSDQRESEIDCFEPRSLNATLADKTPICTVVASEKFEALAFIDQRSMKQLEVGQSVELLLDEYATQVLRGTLVEIKTGSSKVVPDGLFRQAGGLHRSGCERRPWRVADSSLSTCDSVGRSAGRLTTANRHARPSKNCRPSRLHLPTPPRNDPTSDKLPVELGAPSDQNSVM